MPSRSGSEGHAFLNDQPPVEFAEQHFPDHTDDDTKTSGPRRLAHRPKRVLAGSIGPRCARQTGGAPRTFAQAVSRSVVAPRLNAFEWRHTASATRPQNCGVALARERASPENRKPPRWPCVILVARRQRIRRP